MSHAPALDWVRQPPLPATFPNDDGYDQLVVALAIPFQGLPQPDNRPVAGTAHIGYHPAELLLDGATLGLLVEFHAALPQSQADMTQHVAEDLATHLSPRGVGVMVEAEPHRAGQGYGAAIGPRSITTALLGTLRTVPSCRRQFFAVISMSS